MENQVQNAGKVIVPSVTSVVLALLSFVSIFLPWFSGQGENISMIGIMKLVNDLAAFDAKANLFYLLLLIPIFSLVIIGVEMNNKVKEKVWSQIGKIIILIINLAALAGLIYVQSLLEGLKATVFDIMGYGYWIALVSSLFLLVTIFTRPRSNAGNSAPVA